MAVIDFSSNHVTYDDLVQFFGMRPGRLKLTEQEAKLAGISKGLLLLEIGCGDGRSSLFLSSEFGCRVVGIDPRRPMITLALGQAKGLSGGVYFLLADVMQMPFTDCTFDFVIGEAVLSGIGDKEKAVKECHRVLKSRGKFVIGDFILRRDADMGLKSRMDAFPCAGAKRIEEYVNLFEEVGFEEPVIEDHSEQMKAIGCWIALHYGSVAKFFAKIASGLYRRGEDNPNCTSAEVYKEFFDQAMFGYALLCLTKP